MPELNVGDKIILDGYNTKVINKWASGPCFKIMFEDGRWIPSNNIDDLIKSGRLQILFEESSKPIIKKDSGFPDFRKKLNEKS